MAFWAEQEEVVIGQLRDTDPTRFVGSSFIGLGSLLGPPDSARPDLVHRFASPPHQTC